MPQITPTIHPTHKQHIAWQTLQDKQTRFLFFGGGAGGGKSWLGAEWLLTSCYFYPRSKWFIGREELKRLMASSFITFQKVCQFHQIPKEAWNVNSKWNYIEFENGSRIDLLDLKHLPSDPDYERFGSLEYTGGWIDEASEVNFKAFDVLKSRCGRHLNTDYNLLPKMLCTLNPSKEWPYRLVYKPWKDKTLSPEYAFIQSLYRDNPHTAEIYGLQLAQLNDRATKERLMFGNWEYEDDPATLITYEAILDLFTNTLEESKERYMTADIARFGEDKTVIIKWEGWEAYEILVRERQGLDVTLQLLKDIAAKDKIPYSHIVVDEDGVGGGIVDMMRGIYGFTANSTPMEVEGEKPNFANLKTQCTYKFAELVNAHKVAISVESEVLRELIIEDLEQMKGKDIDMDKKLMLRPKEEIKELLGRSPDYGDALMMRAFFEFDRKGSGAVKIYQPQWKSFGRI